MAVKRCIMTAYADETVALLNVLGQDAGDSVDWNSRLQCWYFQKQFFDGKVHELSTDDYVMRYDVEVSGFPSSHAGHLSLLGFPDADQWRDRFPLHLR